MRIAAVHLILILPCLLVACGDERVSATTSETASSTTNMSGEGSGSESESGSETETESGSETETGEPTEVCWTCAEDELCVAYADDACDELLLYCVPGDPACADNECDPECLAAVCGNDICPPPCGQFSGVDVWCSGPTPSVCDPILQDCPEGEKCVPYASQGGTWDNNECVPVTGDNMVGEACMSTGVIEATDDCDASGMCFGLDDELMGTCYGFCGPGGTCPNAQTCLIANDESLALCLDDCVPHHSENCAAGTVCFGVQADVFMCLPAQPLPPDSPCVVGDYCPLGQACVPTSELDSCAGESCCTDWCDTAEPDPCTLPLTCQPYWPQGQAPAGLETAGVCKLG